jgi:hypothetical protein
VASCPLFDFLEDSKFFLKIFPFSNNDFFNFQHPFPALGDNLRHRYDEAFIRNEVTNLRDQVTVLHDTLGDFITRIDKRLLGHDEVQRKLGSRIAQLERLFKFKSTESPKKPSLAVVVSPTKSPKQTRDTPSSIEGGEPGTSDSEPAVSMTNSYRILDVHGNVTDAYYLTRRDRSRRCTYYL